MMLRRTLPLVTLVVLAAALAFLARADAGGAATLPTDVPATTQPDKAADKWPVIERILGPGQLKDNVYTIALPRKDLAVTSELGDVPVEAGLASTFWFFPCPCGKMSVVGAFCLADYEANDVIDELRAGGLKVASVAPMMLGERPRLLVVRFQGDAHDTEVLASALKKALNWVGENRTKAQVLDGGKK